MASPASRNLPPSLQRLSGLLLRYAAPVIILLGAALRIAVWLQNRDLMIDEVNVVRNIYERDFSGLLRPLDYQQYAPPLFLWIVKGCSLLFGFGEKALRLYPLLASIAALPLLYWVLKALQCCRSFWLPLSLMATGYIYILYGTDVKQYLPDVMITLSLLLLALRFDIRGVKATRFFAVWTIAGSLAIWASMPSIFILTGIGAYYLSRCLGARQYGKLIPLAAAGAIWAVQFGFYYWFILKPQADSDYLQQWHAPYFLHLLLQKGGEWESDKWVLTGFFGNATGDPEWSLSMAFMLVLLLTGMVHSFRKDVSRGLLLTLPLFCLILAAGLRKFTLIPRVSLFAMPLLLLLIGIGLQYWLGRRWLAVQILVTGLSLWGICRAGQLQLFREPIEIDELNRSVRFANARGVADSSIYIQDLLIPSRIYYTRIHPDMERRRAYLPIRLIGWTTNLDSLSRTIPVRTAFIYFWLDEETLSRHKRSFASGMKPVDSLIKPGYKVFVYDPLPHHP